MGFKKRRKTLLVADIPDSARKDIEYLFLLDVVILQKGIYSVITYTESRPNAIIICSYW